MSVGPRIVFVRFHSSDSPRLMPWTTHAARVIGDPAVAAVAADEPVGDGIVVWQLVSANNRQLARGTSVHATFEGAHRNAQGVVESAALLTVAPVSEPGRGLYGWFASSADGPAITCARWYVTDRDRRHSIELALRCLAVATLHDGARQHDHETFAHAHDSRR